MKKLFHIEWEPDSHLYDFTYQDLIKYVDISDKVWTILGKKIIYIEYYSSSATFDDTLDAIYFHKGKISARSTFVKSRLDDFKSIQEFKDFIKKIEFDIEMRKLLK